MWGGYFFKNNVKKCDFASFCVMRTKDVLAVYIFLPSCLILWSMCGKIIFSYRSEAGGIHAMKNFMNAMYALNIVLQSFWTLLMPIGLAVFLGWILTEKCGFGQYVFVILILLGVVIGMISMVKFLLSALAGLERLENEQKNHKKNK